MGFVLKEGGAEIILANRTEEKGKSLAGELKCSFLPLHEAGGVEADILIQTTPVGMFPKSEELSSQAMDLPMFPGLADDQIKYISEKIHEFYKR